MKNTILFFLTLFALPCVIHGQAQFPKTISKQLKDMVFLQGGNGVTGSAIVTFPVESDTNLLYAAHLRRQKTDDFYISNHEVTNSEYLEFIHWVKDSILKSNAANPMLHYSFQHNGNKEIIAVLPDTNVWKKTIHIDHYLRAETFKNYPVVGVTYYQALAYCYWKTARINEMLEKEKSALRVQFTLPTAKEWQYAATSSPLMKNGEYSLDHFDYPWVGFNLKDEKGNYRANFGEYSDRNNVPQKNFLSDGYMYTAPVKQYAPNQHGIYDLAGNVSEWTLDAPDVLLVSQSYLENRKTGKFLSVEEVDKLWNLNDPNLLETNDSIQENDAAKYGFQVFSNRKDSDKIRKFAPARIVKGGSFHNAPVYLLCGKSQIFNENSSNETIGFRVVMKVLN